MVRVRLERSCSLVGVVGLAVVSFEFVSEFERGLASTVRRCLRRSEECDARCGRATPLSPLEFESARLICLRGDALCSND